MASIRDLKKDINFVLGDIIEAVIIWETINKDADKKESEAIIDDAIDVYDDLIVKVNNKQVDDRPAHLSAVRDELEQKGRVLIERLNALS